MLNTYGYSLEPGAKSLKCINYYTNEEIQVPLDSQLSAHENSVKYFDRYAKLKRTWEALSVQIQETKDELEHLDSISTALDIAVSEDDLIQLKEELIQLDVYKRQLADSVIYRIIIVLVLIIVSIDLVICDFDIVLDIIVISRCKTAHLYLSLIHI